MAVALPGLAGSRAGRRRTAALLQFRRSSPGCPLATREGAESWVSAHEGVDRATREHVPGRFRNRLSRAAATGEGAAGGIAHRARAEDLPADQVRPERPYGRGGE